MNCEFEMFKLHAKGFKACMKCFDSMHLQKSKSEGEIHRTVSYTMLLLCELAKGRSFYHDCAVCARK